MLYKFKSKVASDVIMLEPNGRQILALWGRTGEESLRKGILLAADMPVAISALEEAIENFAGCAVVISHDRFFLDRLATHILAFEGNSHVEWFEGNFEAYEEDKRRRLGDAADRPTRLAYKKLTR
jgi:hypothetical protein